MAGYVSLKDKMRVRFSHRVFMFINLLCSVQLVAGYAPFKGRTRVRFSHRVCVDGAVVFRRRPMVGRHALNVEIEGSSPSAGVRLKGPALAGRTAWSQAEWRYPWEVEEAGSTPARQIAHLRTERTVLEMSAMEHWQSGQLYLTVNQTPNGLQRFESSMLHAGRVAERFKAADC